MFWPRDDKPVQLQIEPYSDKASLKPEERREREKMMGVRREREDDGREEREMENLPCQFTNNYGDIFT
ncbi:hypothetical protein L484_019088 [Morus notabilis]|uniref:Uncharacterized protein n=1 Tax=Morus notabilis TaxID=981085 RepID=W9SJ66_9ROSA|nr:hypothetical protein L484_019088 [Morus notabilis]